MVQNYDRESLTRDLNTRARLWAPRLLTAGLAGMAASIPMAFVMLGIQRMLGKHEQYALPPEEITVKVAGKAHADPVIEDKTVRRTATWLAHLGYGAAAASVYPVITSRLQWPPVLRGMLFALGVWAASYMGWLPAARILPPATDMSTGRNAMMVASHLVWGALIGWIVNKMEENNL